MLAMALALIAAPAFAADIARPVYKAPPAPVVTYNWTGFYVGGNAGWYNFDTDQTSRPANDLTAAAWTACFNAGSCVRNFGGQSGDGFIGGVQAGYNWQTSNVVFGVEADWNWTSKSGTASIARNVAFIPEFTGTATTEMDWLGTVRGRAGILVSPNLLAYATGGWAYGQVNRTFNAGYSTLGQTYSGSSKEILNGWTLGGGIEWAFGNGWSLGAEYLYVKLNGDGGYTSSAYGSGCNASFCQYAITSTDVTENIVRAKLNYKFDWGKAPVMAKY